ncbi:MAG: M20/M25/M40 family metallo-hydrolase [Bradymonadaceae bacterium]|nr:M20/M25/M40 family metallo-hydrolase [Lujinxingiaceae bacterium]
MPEKQFGFMRDILAAPSPVGLEAAMTFGVLQPELERLMLGTWSFCRFKGNAGLVLDTHPGKDDMFSVMVIGHADKIRMQVRSIGDDGKIWIDSDSFLPSTLIGHEVLLFSEDPGKPGTYRVLEGATIEAVGAIHFADAALRSGETGIKKEQLYLELQVHGEKKKEQILERGIRPGDSIILNRPIRPGFSPNTFYGAYLDNGLGCFVTAEVARLIAERGGLKNVRVLFAFASYEEIGRFGSRVLAAEFMPDVVVGVDVNHDFVAAPNIGDKRNTPLEMGKGYTLSIGSVASEFLNRVFEEAAKEHGIPVQRDVCGRDTGTDAMAGVLANIDAAATSIGFPIRNMHTISESGHTGDVIAAIHGIARTLERMDAMNNNKGVSADDFRDGHPRLDRARKLE